MKLAASPLKGGYAKCPQGTQPPRNSQRRSLLSLIVSLLFQSSSDINLEHLQGNDFYSDLADSRYLINIGFWKISILTPKLSVKD